MQLLMLIRIFELKAESYAYDAFGLAFKVPELASSSTHLLLQHASEEPGSVQSLAKNFQYSVHLASRASGVEEIAFDCVGFHSKYAAQAILEPELGLGDFDSFTRGTVDPDERAVYLPPMFQGELSIPDQSVARAIENVKRLEDLWQVSRIH